MKKGNLRMVKFGIYLNVLRVVVFTELSISQAPSQEGPDTFGVDLIKELPEPKGIENELNREWAMDKNVKI